MPVSFASLAPGRSHVRCVQHPTGVVFAASGLQSDSGEIDLEPAISVIAERAQTLTGASGAAIALRKGDEMVCRARSGRTAPDLGVRLQSDSGISADCVRTGEVVLCHDAAENPHVDLAACQRLGVRSILAAPLRHFRRTLGVFEVFSAAPYAFAARDVATMQLLSSVMVAAISRLSGQKRPLHRLPTLQNQRFSGPNQQGSKCRPVSCWSGLIYSNPLYGIHRAQADRHFPAIQTVVERRQSVRLKVHSPAYANLDESSEGGGRELNEILDINEQGMSIQTSSPLNWIAI